jgi:hypothetical protein
MRGSFASLEDDGEELATGRATARARVNAEGAVNAEIEVQRVEGAEERGA